MKLITHLAVLALALTLTAGPAVGQAQPASAEATLLKHAADDFRQHTTPPPDHFRRVHLGQFTAPDGRTRTVLCGEFKAGEPGRWARFVTVQTDPYEQWLGDSAEGWCKRPGFKPTGKDLSAALKQQLAAPAAISSAPAR
jgi:hypothetical protein